MPNSISEWFGHRVYPTVAKAATAMNDQKERRCPFLSAALGENLLCIKAQNSRGVCTVSSELGGRQMDWVVCPYRTLNSPLIETASRRLFGVPGHADVELFPAPALAHGGVRDRVRSALASGSVTVVYFMDKLGGEIDLPGSEKSPKFKLDATMVQMLPKGDGIVIGKHGILEVQTMDYHGTYQHATKELTDALRLHPRDFARQLEKNPEWASKKVEGPNIANVFKRTIYQVLFKFQLGTHAACAGAALAIPESVWLSWQPHLGAPKMVQISGDAWGLEIAGQAKQKREMKGWILVFEIDASREDTPNPVVVKRVIQTDARTLSHLAYEKAPEEAMSSLANGEALRAILQRRIAEFWPDIWPVDHPGRRGGRRASC